MDYIATHRSEVEAEYEMVVQQAEESRQYWEARNRERFATLGHHDAKTRTGSHPRQVASMESQTRHAVIAILVDRNIEGQAVMLRGTLEGMLPV